MSSPVRPPVTARLRRLLLLVLALLVTSPAAAQTPELARPKGIVKVTSPQPGSATYVDNELIGDAPLTRYLDVGSHILRVTADGFDPFVRKVDIVANQTVEVAAVLLPGNGTVEFQVQPAGAVLIIDDKDEWPLPVRLSSLEPGNYPYRIEARGHETLEGSFDFQPGKNLLIVETLKSSAGLISVQTRPDRARVWIDDVDVGMTPVDAEGITAGVHSVRIEKDGYATLIRTLDTSDGSKGQLDARLPRQGASLVVSTGRDNAEVRVNGTLMGTGSVVRIKSLERGRYPVTVTAPGYHAVDGRADVPQRGRAAYKCKLQPTDARASSRFVPIKPLYERWTFWTVVGVGAAGGATGGLIAWKASQPVPIEEGDIVVALP